MTTLYCYPCATARGLTAGAVPSNLTGSSYQVDKFIKHTIPQGAGDRLTGVFSDPSYDAYSGYIVSSSLSGSVEIDDSGRTNRVWYAGSEIGASWRDGQPVLPNDAVKLVKEHDQGKVHAFSISSAPYSGETCTDCGCSVLR